MCLTAEATQRTGNDRKVLVTFTNLNKAQKGIRHKNLEYLDVIWAVLRLRPYIEESPFYIQMNYDGLQQILNTKYRTGNLPKWDLPLLEFGFPALHRIRAKPQEPDALSQLPVTGMNEYSPQDDLTLLMATKRQ